MARKGGQRRSGQKRNIQAEPNAYQYSVWYFLATVAKYNGLPGLGLLLVAGLVYWYATLEQGQEIIETWVLFRHWHGWALIAFAVSIVVLLRWIDSHYRKRCSDMQQELDRCADEKTKLQEELANRELHHSRKKE